MPLGDGHRLYVNTFGARSILNLGDGSHTALPKAHEVPANLSIDATGSIIASGHLDGEIRVGRLFDEEPHLLLGHEAGETFVRVSPDGRWVASVGSDGTARLWPMPDLSEPPFHTLPYVELMARLKAQTNLRAMPDEESHTGYSIAPDSTAGHGWETVPTW